MSSGAHLPPVVDLIAEVGADALGEVAVLGRLAHLGGDEETQARPVGNGDGVMGALLGGHPAEEQEVVAATLANGEGVGVDAVVDHRRDGQLGSLGSLGVRDGDGGDPRRDRPVDFPAGDETNLHVLWRTAGGMSQPSAEGPSERRQSSFPAPHLSGGRLSGQRGPPVDPTPGGRRPARLPMLLPGAMGRLAPGG